MVLCSTELRAIKTTFFLFYPLSKRLIIIFWGEGRKEGRWGSQLFSIILRKPFIKLYKFVEGAITFELLKIIIFQHSRRRRNLLTDFRRLTFNNFIQCRPSYRPMKDIFICTKPRYKHISVIFFFLFRK